VLSNAAAALRAQPWHPVPSRLASPRLPSLPLPQVVVSTTGPYELLGEPVVAACIRLGTHYVDLSGEMTWVGAWLSPSCRSVVVMRMQSVWWPCR
jgi:hypothetical protein